MNSVLDELEMEIKTETRPRITERVAVEAARRAPEPPVQEAKPKSPGSMRKWMLRIAGAAAVVALTVAGASAWLSTTVSTDDAQVDGHIVNISPKVSGHVVEVLVRDNQAVKAGDVLVRIDDRDFQAQVAQAKAALLEAESGARAASVSVPLTSESTTSATSYASAQLAAAEADYLRAQASAEQAKGSGIAYAEANIASKQADSDRARADLERMRPLAAKEEISRQQFDSFVAASRVAESELHAVQERLASARKQAEIQDSGLLAAKARVDQARAAVAQSVAGEKQVAVRSADLGTAMAHIEAAKANLAAAELQAGYTEIVAPAGGVVTRKSVEVGQLVQPGQGLLVLVPLDDVWVTANFKETQLAGVKAGQAAKIKVDMYGRTLTGRVDSISGVTGSRLSLLPPENATGNYVKVVQRIPVKIVLNPSDLREFPLRVGMNVEAAIDAR